MTKPHALYEYDTATKQSTVIFNKRVPNYDQSLYETRLLEAPGHDGTYEDYRNYVNAPMGLGMKYDLIFIDGRARPHCAKVAVGLLKPGGFILIHDMMHPNEQYRRREYETVLEFLEHKGGEFTLQKFVPRANAMRDPAGDPSTESAVSSTESSVNSVPSAAITPSTQQPEASSQSDLLQTTNSELPTDKDTCWYQDAVIESMNRFHDIHIKGHNLAEHLKAFTDLLAETDNDGEEIIDLGCGTAMLSQFFPRHTYIGADLPHIISGCAMRNYPEYMYHSLDLVTDNLEWIKKYNIVVVNGVIDIMQHPLHILEKILQHVSRYLIIHRQEITENGQTHTIKNPSYNSVTYHSIINRKDFVDLLDKYDFDIVKTTVPGFSNWENGGCSFLVRKRKSWALYEMDHKLKKYLNKTDGFFIEAGANDGLTQSNTMFFEFYKNWSGILIEPIPDIFVKCIQNRSVRNIYVQGALVDSKYKKGTIQMIYTKGCYGLMSIVNDEKAPIMMKRTMEVGEHRTSRALTLNAILSENEKALPRVIDLMVLDLEGYELNALKGIDFDKYNITYLLIEQLDGGTEIMDYLEPWYEQVDKLSENDFLYQRKSLVGSR